MTKAGFKVTTKKPVAPAVATPPSQPNVAQQAFQQAVPTAQDELKKFMEYLKSIYPGDKSPVDFLDYPIAAKVVTCTQAPATSVFPKQAVQVDDSPNRVHFEQNGSVTIDVNDINKLASEAALSAASVASNGNIESVEVTGSPEERVIMYLAAKSQNLKVSNEAEILAIREGNPAVWSKAAPIWDNHLQSQGIMSVASDKVSKVLNLPIGVIASEMSSAISPKDADNVANIQAAMVALVDKGYELPKDDGGYVQVFKLFDGRGGDTLDNPATLSKLMTENGVTAQDLAAARALVDSGVGVSDDVPKFGQLLEKTGALPGDIKNSFLLAQASSRALDVLNTVEGGSLASGRALKIFDRDPQELQDSAALYNEVLTIVPGDTVAIEAARDKALEGLSLSAVQLDSQGDIYAARDIRTLVESYETPAPVPAAQPKNASPPPSGM